MAEGLAIVTGASTGIGLELARCAARDGHPLLIAANEPEIERAAEELRGKGVAVEAAQVDLSTDDGVLALWARVGAREVDVVAANAGIGYGHRFVEQSWEQVRETIGLNAMGTARLLHLALPRMIARGQGGSSSRGAWRATCRAPSWRPTTPPRRSWTPSPTPCARRSATLGQRHHHLPDARRHGDAVLRPRRHARDGDGRVAQARPRVRGADRLGSHEAGQAGITPGLLNKLMATFAGVIPDAVLARMHRVMLKPRRGGRDGQPTVRLTAQSGNRTSTQVPTPQGTASTVPPRVSVIARTRRRPRPRAARLLARREAEPVVLDPQRGLAGAGPCRATRSRPGRRRASGT
jgi:hypothetical protein